MQGERKKPKLRKIDQFLWDGQMTPLATLPGVFQKVKGTKVMVVEVKVDSLPLSRHGFHKVTLRSTSSLMIQW